MPYPEFVQWAKQQHDVTCNQKYDTDLPYSKHLDFVMDQARLFKHLLPEGKGWVVMAACAGHDLIEDARVTYNDIRDKIGPEVADIIYACTEEKGRNRDERHSEKYYLQLSTNPLAIFVKLCDIIANVKFSILTNSTMLAKLKNEHPKTTHYLYLSGIAYGDMFRYLDVLFDLEIK